MKSLLFIISMGLISSWSSGAKVQFETNYQQAAEAAQKSQLPFAVMVHGSSWHPASKKFMQQLWNVDTLDGQLTHPLILTDVEIHQGLSKEQAEQQAAARKGWQDKGISSYPALQLFSADGQLLKVFQGRQVRALASPSALVAHLNALAKAGHERAAILQQLDTADVIADQDRQLELLSRLLKLPLQHGKQVIERLKAADPEDKTGWQARLNFNESGYLRSITKRIDDGQADQALAAVNGLLAKNIHTPSQTAALLGAKGKILIAKQDYVAAWAQFRLAHETDPYGSTGNTMLNYGEFKALVPSRGGVTKESALYKKDIGDNISRDFASYKISSNSNDDGSAHDSLLQGAVAQRGFAFHTAAEKEPHIIIDLGEVCEVRALDITNRIGAEHHARAANLSLLMSADNHAWTPVWKAKKASASWGVWLEKPIHARYLKLMLMSASPEYFHLSSVNVFGKRN